jgi:N utilization substance protein B
MSTRRRAREVVLQLLYEADINNTRDADSMRRFIRSRMQGRRALTEFAWKLLEGTLEHRDAIDHRLAEVAMNWSLSRMSVVDRNVLRLGAFEIMFADTPDRVAVNEAILLAKRYGDTNSPRFINGVLDRLMKIEGPTTPPQPANRLSS